MKKQSLSFLVLVTVAFAAFTLGYFLGNTRIESPVQLSVPAEVMTTPSAPATVRNQESEPTTPIIFPININQAEKEELMALPGIGEVLAHRILAYRQEHGSFQTPEALMNVEGIGKKRLEQILDLISIGG